MGKIPIAARRRKDAATPGLRGGGHSNPYGTRGKVRVNNDAETLTCVKDFRMKYRFGKYWDSKLEVVEA